MTKSDINAKPFYDEKKITGKNQIGITMIQGVLFALMGYLGSYSANFMWKIQQDHPKFLIVSGITALFAFSVICVLIIWVAKKYLD